MRGWLFAEDVIGNCTIKLIGFNNCTIELIGFNNHLPITVDGGHDD